MLIIADEIWSLRCEMTGTPLEWVLGCDRMVSESIPDPGVGVCLAP